MNPAVLTADATLPGEAPGTRALHVAGRAWFLIASTGQWLFAAYVAVFFGGAALDGELSRWNEELPRGYIPGQPFDNFVVATHLFLAFVALAGGPLQFVRSLRERFPRAHRWNGRLYLLTAASTALAGIYVMATRGSVGDLTLHVGMAFNTLLIVAFAWLAWRAAVDRDLAAHRVWVLRLFMVVGGMWFFRVGLMFWMSINQGAVGFDIRTFSGPFITFMGFAQTLLPLAGLQLYLAAERSGSAGLRYAAAGVVGALTVAMALGLYVAANTMWLPRF